MTTLAHEKLGLLLSETARAWRTKLDRRLKPLGLSQGKWTTLVHLAHAGKVLTQRDIAERVGVEEPTAAGVLRRLEQDGWIERKASVNDRRCKTVQLRRRSDSLLGQIFATARKLRHELLADIPARDLDTCMRVLDQIRARAEAISQNGKSHSNGRTRIRRES